MEGRPVIPDGDIVAVLPADADLQVVVVDQQLGEPLQQRLGLELGHVVDVRQVAADGEDGLPARDRVGAHDGVDGGQLLAHVEGRAAGLVVDLEVAALGGGDEAGLRKGGRQALEELLVRCGDAVVDLVAGAPERVAAGLGEVDEAEGRVVCGDGLE